MATTRGAVAAPRLTRALVALSLACSIHPASADDEAARKLLDGLWTGKFYEASEESLDLVLAMPAEAQAAWLVQFYTPWCVRCQSFDAEWGELAASTDQRGPESRLRLARLDASDSTATIKRFKLKSFPEFLLFNGSSYHRFRGELSLPTLQAFVSSGGGVGAPEAVRAPSPKFALHQLGDEDATDEEQQLTQLGLAIAGGVFLLGLFLGCFCSLRRCVCLLTCGLCCGGQRDDGRRARRNLKPKRE